MKPDEILGLYYSKTAILHPYKLCFKLYQRSQRKVLWEGMLALLPWPWRNDSIKSSSAPPRPPCPRKSYICQSNSFLVWVRNCDIFSFSSQTFGTTLLLLALCRLKAVKVSGHIIILLGQPLHPEDVPFVSKGLFLWWWVVEIKVMFIWNVTN